jgi:GTPase Era involved in 16S rRNA processing
MTHKIDSALDKFQKYTTNDVQRIRYRRLTNVLLKENYIIDVVFLFLDRKSLNSKKTTILKSIMHLKTRNYSMNEIIDKQTLSQNLERSMSSFSRQRSVSVVQMLSNQTSNAFDILKNRLNTQTSQKTAQSTQTQTSIQSQTVSKSRERSLNSRKTIESRQNDDEL